jgi:hypothetical protein
MITNLKTKSFTTNKYCCKKHKSLIKVTRLDNDLNIQYRAECFDCGNTIVGYTVVRSLLVTRNPIITPFLLNQANQN